MGLLQRATTLKELLTKDNLFKRVTPLQIFEYYTNKRLSLPTTILSPLRKEDVASFCIFGRNSDNVFFEDKTTKDKGNAIDFVMLLHDLTFYEALVKINIDLNAGLMYNHSKYTIERSNNKIPDKKEVTHERKVITIRYHKDMDGNPTFLRSGRNYWNKYGISMNTLHRHNVFSAENVFINGEHFIKYVDVNPVFAYLYEYKHNYYYKIYRPLSAERKHKFYNDFHGVSKYLIHGAKLLPEKGDTLIITKSAKDCMVLDELGFHSVGVQSEGLDLLPHHMEWFRKRWNNVYILYDNDWNKEKNWGQIHAKSVIETYPFIKNLCIPTEHKSTDISDTIAKYGKIYTNRIMKKMLKR